MVRSLTNGQSHGVKSCRWEAQCDDASGLPTIMLTFAQGRELCEECDFLALTKEDICNHEWFIELLEDRGGSTSVWGPLRMVWRSYALFTTWRWFHDIRVARRLGSLPGDAT